jgi:4-hydroxybenzoate polyprenyltransferase
MKERVHPLFYMVAGFGIWGSAFVLLYATASLGCELGWNQTHVGPVSLTRAILIGLWLVHMAALIWLYRHCAHAQDNGSTGRFMRHAALYLTLAAIASTVWIAFALGVPSDCT